MAKQTMEVDVNDFAQVISCVGLTLTMVGLSLPDSPQKELIINMGDELLVLLLKYSSEDKQEFLLEMKNAMITDQADMTVIN